MEGGVVVRQPGQDDDANDAARGGWTWVTVVEATAVTALVYALVRAHRRGTLVPWVAATWATVSAWVAQRATRMRKRSQAGPGGASGGTAAGDGRPGGGADIELGHAGAGIAGGGGSGGASGSGGIGSGGYTPALVGVPPGDSPLLATSQVRGLAAHLPSRCAGKDWHLLFSTARDGYSLATLYARARHRGPTLLVAMDDKGYVFGGFASRDWSGNDLVTSSMPYSRAFAAVRAMARGSSGLPAGVTHTASYFGSGESFLFTAAPAFAVYRWTRRNNSFLLARADCIAFGGGGGKFGLYLDANLENGCSGPCDTYANATLSADELFRAVRVEVWGFVLPALIAGAAGRGSGGSAPAGR